MSWRLAKSLEMLRHQINEQWPQRSKASDGTIGNAEHAARTSDHNPWVKLGNMGIVTGLDITHDPAHGLDSEQLANALLKSRDPRIKYVISNRKIASGNSSAQPWKWRTYTGKNPHNHHCHISVNADVKDYDDDAPWGIAGTKPPPAGAVVVSHPPTLKLNDSGPQVGQLQKLLGITVDGQFGPLTEKAVRNWQEQNKLVVDGVVGSYTWEILTKKDVT